MEEYIEYHCTPPCNKLLTKYVMDTEKPYAFEIKCPSRKCHRINYRGNVISINLVEFRCPSIDPKKSAKAGKDVVCNKLLARILPGTKLHIKCPRCGSFVYTQNPEGTESDE